MVCPKCGLTISEGNAVCPMCGSDIATAASGPVPVVGTTSSVGGGAGVATAPAVAPPPMLAKRDHTRRNSILGVAALALVLLMNFVVHLRLTGGNIPYGIGATFGAVLLPGIFVALYYRRRPASPGRVALVLAAWTLLMSVISINGAIQRSAQKSQLRSGDIRKLAQEGAGKRTVEDPGNEGQQLLRELFGKVKQFNEHYVAEIHGLQAPKEVVMSAESFRDRATMERVLTYLKTVRAVEQKQQEGTAKLIEDMRAKVKAKDWTERDKQQYLSGFDHGLGASMQVRRDVMTSEIAWLDAVEDLYGFTLDNQQNLKVAGGRVVIDSAQVVSGYNERIERANKLRTEFLSKMKDFETQQRNRLAQMGLSPEDVGLPAWK